MATAVFHQKHPSVSGAPPCVADVRAVCALASLMARRSAALVAASVYALWALKAETEQAYIASSVVPAHADRARGELAIVQSRTVVAFNGSVIERYPHYLEQCQDMINALAASTKTAADAVDAVDGTAPSGTIDLVPAKDSSLLGAAVALACLSG